MAQSNVKPTRMELLNTKQKLVLAEKGHKILKQKRDALIMEFFTIVKKAKDLRSQVDASAIRAYQRLAVATALHGEIYLRSLALTAHKAPTISVNSKNIMGVRIPTIQGEYVLRNIQERGYSVQSTSATIDETVGAFEETLSLTLKLAETEAALKRLLTEIEKTNRRVNALEFNIQPAMRATIKDIAGHLNRLESERFFSLKITKKRLNRKADEEDAARKAKKKG